VPTRVATRLKEFKVLLVSHPSRKAPLYIDKKEKKKTELMQMNRYPQNPELQKLKEKKKNSFMLAHSTKILHLHYVALKAICPYGLYYGALCACSLP